MPVRYTVDYSALKSVGLTTLDVRCYETLFQAVCSYSSVNEIHNKLGQALPNKSIYRSLKRLTELGFVDTRHIIGAQRYRAPE